MYNNERPDFAKITDNDMVQELIDFICSKSLWKDFVEDMKRKGYTEEDFDDF